MGVLVTELQPATRYTYEVYVALGTGCVINCMQR
jgi:hypothetical protein